MNFGSELKKFLYVTNIPAPYRIELHNVMFREMKKNGIYFEVAFMSRTEKIRNWDVDSMLRKAKFPSTNPPYELYVKFAASAIDSSRKKAVTK